MTCPHHVNRRSSVLSSRTRPLPECRVKGKRGSSQMLAATDQREIRPSNGNLRHLDTRMPRPIFRAAYKELCTRIWIELELLAQALGEVDSRSPRDLALSTAILRLELVVLVDSCRSPRWRRMLSTDQRDSLCSMLTDVLAALYVDPEHLNTALVEAQDRVLDELLPEAEAIPSPSDPAPAYEFGQGSPAAVNELMSLIEAQAAARAAQ